MPNFTAARLSASLNAALSRSPPSGCSLGPPTSTFVTHSSPRRRSEERRGGKSVDLGVTGVQTCALPIRPLKRVAERRLKPVAAVGLLAGAADVHLRHPFVAQAQIGRASWRKECRSRCDWSSDVCSSDPPA